jgi:DNA-directed RNA polymerase specialized sigma24 family protein
MAPIRPAQLGAWYEAFGDTMVFFVRQWLDSGAAEEVVQDVFMRLMAGGRRPQNVRAWLFQSVRDAAPNRVRDDRRRQAREAARSGNHPAWLRPAEGPVVDAAAGRDGDRRKRQSAEPLAVGLSPA